MKPDPTPDCDWPNRPELEEAMVTTAGMTLSVALITADDSSTFTVVALEPASVWVPVGADAAGRSAVETAAAERPPETMPTTRAIAATGSSPGVRRSTVGEDGWPATGGRVDHAGAVCQVAGRTGGVGP